jgi:hypothetical protein
MMKKLLLLAFLAVGMTAHAETIVTNSDDQVENKGGIDLGQGKDDDDRWSMHFAVGVDIPVSTNGLDFAPFRSWEFNWTFVQYDYTPKNSNTTISAGLGLDWRSYTLKGHKDGFFKVGDVVAVGQADVANDDFSSNIHTVALNMPVLVKQKFSKNFAVSLGAQLNWNYYARIHNHMEQGDNDTDVYTKKIGQRPFTVDILGIVHVSNGFGFYCKYSPMSVLKKDKGPDFKSLAVGIYF